MGSVIVEIRAGEGGNDAKDLVHVQFDIYRKYCARRNLGLEVLQDRSGYLSFRASGKESERAFECEAGGIRWQRTPPNEKRGRVHTSTITVAVLPEPKPTAVRIDERDLEWQYFRGTGSGGQKKNKTSSAVRCKHIPSGLVVRVESERSQLQNKEMAMAMLRAKLYAIANQSTLNSRAALRKRQVGTGMRADKIRTVQCQNGQVVDHATGWRLSLKKYLRGFW